MDRREFLLNAGSAAFTTLHDTPNAAPVTVQLRQPGKEWPVMPSDFTGLSYESGQLYNPDFFSPSNQALIEVFRNLSSKGVLRLGGHLSNITPWEGVGQDDPKQVRGVRHGIEDYWEWPLVDPSVQRNKRGIITRSAIRNLRGFLDAVGWRLIYGLNFACGSAARAADEAQVVSSIIGDRLVAFVIGNEVDGFGEDPFFRSKGYDFNQYFSEYEVWVKTIRKRVPRAQFAGPDTDGKVDTWVLEFANRTRGDAILLTSHFYGMGPASDDRMTSERLLRKVHADLDAEIAGVRAARAAAGGTPYRMAEGNSCFGGGRKDVSDAYASALWAADYMLRAAGEGFAGVNLHGGGVGIYTPIETSANSPAFPRPLYFGMQLAQQFTGFQVAPLALDTNANFTAYQGNKAGQTKLALINKGESVVQIKLPDPFKSAENIRRWQLKGPAPNAKNGVRFGPLSGPPSTLTFAMDEYSATILEIAST